MDLALDFIRKSVLADATSSYGKKRKREEEFVELL